jgi:hypothetical protein
MVVRSDRYAPRVAGFAFLFLIAVDLTSGFVMGGVRTTGGIGDRLTSTAQHVGAVRISILLSIVAGLTTLVLAGMLYAIVAREDRNLAILALSCRAVEAGLYAVGILRALALLFLSHGYADAAPADASSIRVVADLVVKLGPMNSNVAAIFFAAGSTLFAYLLLRSRAIPVPLSVIGVAGSVLVLVGVSVQTALSRDTFSDAWALIWVPAGVFEISTGVWLLVKGARLATTQPAPRAEAMV